MSDALFLTGNDLHINRKYGTDNINVYSDQLAFNNVASLDTGADSDMVLNRNGNALITLGNDGSDYIDFNGVNVKNLTTAVISELGSDVTINNSLMIGANSGFDLSVDGSNNGVIACGSGKIISITSGGVDQCDISTSGVTITQGNLNIVDVNQNITQSTGNLLYRVATGKIHQFQSNGAECASLSASAFNIPTGSTFKINSSSVLSSSAVTLGNDTVTNSSDNMVLNVPSGKAIDMNISATTQFLVDGNGATLPTGNLYLGTSGSTPNVGVASGNLSFNVATGKNSTFYVNGSGMMAVSSTAVNSNVPFTCASTTDSTTTATGSIITSGGLGVAKKIVCGNGAIIYSSSGSTGNFNISNTSGVTGAGSDTGALTAQIRSSSALNRESQILIQPTYGTTPINGFCLGVAYGDDGSNRYNSAYYIRQYMDSLDLGDGSISAWETRVRYGSRRDINFSILGSATNDITMTNHSGTALLTVNGDINYTGTITDTSDQRVKTNIANYADNNCLATLNKLQLKTYNFVSEYCDESAKKEDMQYIGLIAQDLQAIPELADTVVKMNDVILKSKTETETITYHCDIDQCDKTITRPKQTVVDGLLTVSTQKFVFLSIGAIKQLSKETVYLLGKLKSVQQELIDANNRLNALESSYQTRNNENVFDSVSINQDIKDDAFSALG